MYILKNAWRSIVRSKGRNVLIGIIIFVIAISSCVALSIQEAAKQAKETSMGLLEVTGQITMNRQKMMAGQGNREEMKDALTNMEMLSLEEMEEYAQSEYVKSFYYTASASMNGGDDIEAVDASGMTTEESDTESSVNNEMQSDGGTPGNMMEQSGDNGGGRMGEQGDFTVTGYSSDEAMTAFLDGSSTITDGEMFPEHDTDNQCIISSELATYNDLTTGDTITLTNPNNEEESYTFTISGIYESTQATDSAQSTMGNFSAAFDTANQIYTSYENVKAIATESEAGAEVTTDENTGMETSTALRIQENGTYTFADVEDYEKFKEETDEKLGDYYSVTSNDVSAYEQSLLPLENLSKYAAYFLAIVLIIGGIILVVLNIFNIRERKYEIGVLAAIGMKKGKIAVQFLTELLCVTFIAIFIGAAAGAVVSVPVTNQLLEQQIESASTREQEQMQNFGREMGDMNGGDRKGDMPGEMSGDNMQGEEMQGEAPEAPSENGPGAAMKNYVSQIDSATNFHVIAQLIIIGILLTIVSGCISIVFILRYDPLRILSNRD